MGHPHGIQVTSQELLNKVSMLEQGQKNPVWSSLYDGKTAVAIGYPDINTESAFGPYGEGLTIFGGASGGSFLYVSTRNQNGAAIFTDPNASSPAGNNFYIARRSGLNYMRFDGGTNNVSFYGTATFLGSTSGSATISVSATGGLLALPSGTTATNMALTTPDLGTPSAIVLTNATGTAASLTAGNVTTNANLTGHVTSVGNAAVLGSFTMAQLSTAVSDGDPAYVGAANTFSTGQTISATTSLLLGTAGSAVGTIGFNNATSGTTTLQPATGALGTGTVTLPLTGTLAISSGAQTFTGVQSMTSPDITTSITTPSTTFTAFAGATTLATIGGTGATAVVAIPGTLDASNSTTGSVTIAGGLAVAKKLHLGDSFVVTKAQSADTICQIANTSASSNGSAAIWITNNIGSAYLYASASTGVAGYEAGINRINLDSGGLSGVSLTARGASADIRFYTDGPANANEKMRLHNSGGLSLGNTTDPGASNASITGTFAVTGASTLTGLLTANGGITLGDAQNIAFNTTTGTKIGAATTQKLSFWNATPIVQPTTAVASATVVSPGGGTNIKTDDTFDGYTIAQVVKALRNAGLLA
jgi:hypothetical protein